jgi:hypothetical protein
MANTNVTCRLKCVCRYTFYPLIFGSMYEGIMLSRKQLSSRQSTSSFVWTLDFSLILTCFESDSLLIHPPLCILPERLEQDASSHTLYHNNFLFRNPHSPHNHPRAQIFRLAMY